MSPCYERRPDMEYQCSLRAKCFADERMNSALFMRSVMFIPEDDDGYGSNACTGSICVSRGAAGVPVRAASDVMKEEHSVLLRL